MSYDGCGKYKSGVIRTTLLQLSVGTSVSKYDPALILPLFLFLLSEDACSSLFDVCQTDWKTAHHFPALSATCLLIIQRFSSVDWVWESFFDIPGSPFPYKSSLSNTFLKSLQHLPLYWYEAKGDLEREWQHHEGVKSHLRCLIFVIQQPTLTSVHSSIRPLSWGGIAEGPQWLSWLLVLAQ